jgi:hypothetical protein
MCAGEGRQPGPRHAHERRLHLAATITPELLPVLCPNDSDRPEGRSQINGIAGAGLKHLPPTADRPSLGGIAYRIEESWPLRKGLIGA